MDRLDRKLLRLMQQDASRKYADLGSALNLSPAAVFERVKKLKAKGVIKRVTVDLDPESLGHMLCAFVHVDTEGWSCRPVADALEEEPLVEEVHSVAGSTCLIVKVRAGNPLELEELLHAIHDMKGVQRTQSHVVLQSYIDRGTAPRSEERETASAA